MTDFINKAELLNILNSLEKKSYKAALKALEIIPTTAITTCKSCKFLKNGCFCTKNFMQDGTYKMVFRSEQDSMFCGYGEEKEIG